MALQEGRGRWLSAVYRGRLASIVVYDHIMLLRAQRHFPPIASCKRSSISSIPEVLETALSFLRLTTSRIWASCGQRDCRL